MHVLVATTQSQGVRPGDFSGCVRGELVWVGEPCDEHPLGDPDCRCGRGFAGVRSGGATSTAQVADFPDLTEEEYRETLRGGLLDRGWPSWWADVLAPGLLYLASGWSTGTVIERNLEVIGPRFSLETGELLPAMQHA